MCDFDWDLAGCTSWRWEGTEGGRGSEGRTSCKGPGWPGPAAGSSEGRWRPARRPAGSPLPPQTGEGEEEERQSQRQSALHHGVMSEIKNSVIVANKFYLRASTSVNMFLPQTVNMSWRSRQARWEAHLDGGPQDGELRRFPPGLVGLQDLLDQPLDLPLRHAVAVARLPQDVDALGQLVIDARLAHRGPHGDAGGMDGSGSNWTLVISCCWGSHWHDVTWKAWISVKWK